MLATQLLRNANPAGLSSDLSEAYSEDGKMTKPRHNIAAQVASLGADSRLPDYTDPPFAVAPDIVLDLSAPPPINQVRRINWAKHAKHMEWRRRMGNSVLEFLSMARKQKAPTHIAGRFEVVITVDENANFDLDAIHKQVIDFVVNACLVTDDSKEFMRKITIQWGDVEGVKVILRPCE